MAAGYRASAAGGSNALNTISTATLVPAVGDLWLVIAAETGTSTAGTVSDTNSDPGTYTKIVEKSFNGGVLSIWIRGGFINNTTSTDAIYGPSTGATSNELVVIALSGMRAAGMTTVRQNGVNNGLAATTPSVPLGSNANTANVMIAAIADTTNPPGVTGPAAWALRQNVGQAKPLGLEVYTRDSGFTANNVLWQANSATDWGTIAVELFTNVTDAVDMGTPAGPYLYPRRRESSFSFNQVLGFQPPRVNPMMTFPAKQNTAVTVPVFMRSTTDGSGQPGLTLAVQSKKYGTTFASIAPSVTDRGNGWYDVALTAGMVDTLGPMPLHVTAAGALPNDENIIDVVAVDKQDGVRYGLTSLPNATAGANGGLPLQGSAIPNANANAVGGLATITAVGQGPGGTLKPNCVVDNYTFNAQGSPLTWRERVFASSAAATTAYNAVNTTTGQGNADGTDGEVEREKYTAEYDSGTGKKLLALQRLKEL